VARWDFTEVDKWLDGKKQERDKQFNKQQNKHESKKRMAS
jgi:hypothetical protein